jgi:hypothetical protein
MKRFFVLGLLCSAAVLAPWTATAGAAAADGEIDIVGVEKSGSHELTVWGTIECGTASPVQLDVFAEQQSTGGTGAGADNSHICLEAGDNIKWIVTVTGPGPWMIDDKVTITAVAIFLPDSPDPPVATDTEDHVLRWGR